MGHGAANGDAVAPACKGVRGRRRSADPRRPRGGKRAVHTLGAAQTELDDRSPVRGEADARRLGGDEGLEVQDGEQRALDELRLHEGAVHPHQRLAGECEVPSSIAQMSPWNR